MTDPKDTPSMDPSDGAAVPSVVDLDATDRLLDAIARGGVRATDPGIELLSLAAGPVDDAEVVGAADFVAAVAGASPHRHLVPALGPQRTTTNVFRVVVAKSALLASLLAVGVAGAGAVTGVIAYTAHQNPAPDRLLRPEVTTTKIGQQAPEGDERDAGEARSAATSTAPTTAPTTAHDGAALPRSATERPTTEPLPATGPTNTGPTNTEPVGGADPQDDTTDRDLAGPGAAAMPTSSRVPAIDDEAAGTTPAAHTPPSPRPRPAAPVARARDTGIPWGVCAAGCSAQRATDPPTPAAASTSSRSSATSAPRTDASAPQPRGPRCGRDCSAAERPL